MKRSAFTLIELLVVIAIIAILAVVVVLTLNPAELLRQSRDANRVSDLATLNSALNLYVTDQSAASSFSLGTATTSYISTFDTSATSTLGDQCQGLGMPSSTWTYHCAASSTNRSAVSTGWIPVNLSTISAGSPLSNLPVDPTNQTSSNLYYTYATNGTQYGISAFMESMKYAKSSSAGGADPALAEVGSGASTFPSTGRGLVGYWPLDEGSGSSTLDWSGHGANGTLTGTTLPTWQSGSACKLGSSCLQFTSGYVLANGVTSGVSMSQGFTMMGWINPASSSGLQIFASFALPYLADNAGKDYFSARINGVQQSVGGNTTLTPGIWYFIVGTYDGASLKLYANGVLDGQTSAPGTASFDGPNLYMGNYSTLAYQFVGLIDDFRVYNRVLSASEIQQIYNAEK